MADDILRQGVVGISEIIIKPGLINVDFADVRTIMGDAGTALMGVGTGIGKTRAQDAAVAAISSPLLDFPIKRAKGIVFNVVGGFDLTLAEINAAAEVVYENADPDANIIFGALVDPKMENEVSITVLATGFNEVRGVILQVCPSRMCRLIQWHDKNVLEAHTTTPSLARFTSLHLASPRFASLTSLRSPRRAPPQPPHPAPPPPPSPPMP